VRRRIVLFGATGYTGRLVANEMVGGGLRPVLAGRDRPRLEELADRFDSLEIAVADVRRPDMVRALVGPGDVLVSTVGPFTRFGEPAVAAAVSAGATYLDSSGEPPFVRRLFERWGPAAKRAGVALLPAFAFGSVPGNLAAALALDESGDRARRVDVGYFMPGDRRGWDSGGSRASYLASAIEPSFVWRDGIRGERAAARVRSFSVEGRTCRAISAGTSEHFSLPRLYPRLREVNSYVGHLAGPPRALQVFSLLGSPLTQRAAINAGLRRLSSRLVSGSSGGPDRARRARTRTEVVAIAYDEAGNPLRDVRLAGGNGYEFSARILAWGAGQAADESIAAIGSVGPVEAFGTSSLEVGCELAGMTRVIAA
jgi:short subunit dehydrogenase-like uncharacterized protein